MEYTSVIVDELGHIMYFCSELKEDEIESILENHPEWSRKCIEQ